MQIATVKKQKHRALKGKNTQNETYPYQFKASRPSI